MPLIDENYGGKEKEERNKQMDKQFHGVLRTMNKTVHGQTP